MASVAIPMVAGFAAQKLATDVLGVDPRLAAVLGMAAGAGAGGLAGGAGGSLFGNSAGAAGAANAAGSSGGLLGGGNLTSVAGGGGQNFIQNAIGRQFPLSDFGSAATGLKSTIAPNLAGPVFNPGAAVAGGGVGDVAQSFGLSQGFDPLMANPQAAMGEFGRGFTGAQNMASNPYIDGTPASMYDMGPGTQIFSPDPGAASPAPLDPATFEPTGRSFYDPQAGRAGQARLAQQTGINNVPIGGYSNDYGVNNLGIDLKDFDWNSGPPKTWPSQQGYAPDDLDAYATQEPWGVNPANFTGAESSSTLGFGNKEVESAGDFAEEYLNELDKGFTAREASQNALSKEKAGTPVQDSQYALDRHPESMEASPAPGTGSDVQEGIDELAEGKEKWWDKTENQRFLMEAAGILLSPKPKKPAPKRGGGGGGGPTASAYTGGAGPQPKILFTMGDGGGSYKPQAIT